MKSPRLKPDFHRIDSLPNDTAARARYGHQAPKLIELGSRPLVELLLEARALMPATRREHFDARVKVYSEIKVDVLRATRGDRIPAPPLREVS